jgi:ADP-ribose pyrophosphatase YjhB (NUDIX family)
MNKPSYLINKNNTYCNNCGKPGHMYHQCKMPIISIGTIVFRKINEDIQFLMIRRKHTLGFMDFMRGKYSINNKDFLINLMKEMTIEEKRMLIENDFSVLWNFLWNKSNIGNQYKQEQLLSEEKFNNLKQGITNGTESYSLTSIINNLTDQWEEPEWGFPKGRRNHFERDFDCALREFSEETGYSKKSLVNIENILPFEEIFTGSNYKSYKHKYYLLMMNEPYEHPTESFDKNEVSKIEWKTYEDSLKCIRPYNLEKKRILENVYKCLSLLK